MPIKNKIMKKVDYKGQPYIYGKSFPAGGGLDAKCTYNDTALYCFYHLESKEEIDAYLKEKGFGDPTHSDNHLEIWEKGDTKIYFEVYENGKWRFMYTEYIGGDIDEDEEPATQTYRVSISRVGYASMDFDVEADSEEEAEEFAMNEAYNAIWTEHSAEYEVEYVRELADE